MSQAPQAQPLKSNFLLSIIISSRKLSAPMEGNMHYLDAAIAFAILMAVLAGVVTTTIQSVWRTLKIKQGNLIAVLKKLDKEVLSSSSLDLSPRQRWDTIVNVLNNPTQPHKGLPTADSIAADTKFPRRLVSKFRQLSVDQKQKTSDEKIQAALEGLGRQHALASQYDRVSAEHVVRRLTEVAGQTQSLTNHEQLSSELNLVVRKFEEFSAAMSAEFSRRSFWWSISVGIVLAIGFNVNGIVAFDAFLQDPALAEHVVISGEGLAGGTTGNESLKNVDRQLRELSGAGIPIGLDRWPHCLINGETADCQVFLNIQTWPIAFLLWLLSCILTGVFMGLGAPFWFDVAKRMSAVRTVFRGLDTAAKRMSGADANGDAEKRIEIVANVVRDHVGGEPMIRRKTFRKIVDQSELTIEVTTNNNKVQFLGSLLGGDDTEIQWTHAEIEARISHTLESAAQLYRLDLEVMFMGNDKSSIHIHFPNNQAADWAFTLEGSPGQITRVICPIFMA